jgi:GntR family transcriptional regulator of vanillate catabolism
MAKANSLPRTIGTQSAPKTHTIRAQIELRKRILNGDIEGGTRLFEVPIAEMLDISRTPVREALSRLAEEGLLDRVSAGGYAVRKFSISDVVDSIEIRAVLEGTAARLAAERGVGDDQIHLLENILSQIDECFGKTVEDVDIEGYAEFNAKFHATLADLPGSAVVKREIERASRLPFASPSAFLPDAARIVDFRRSLMIGQEQHRAIAEAIASNEGARAEAITREHARAARRNLEHMFSKDPATFVDVPGFALIVS